MITRQQAYVTSDQQTFADLDAAIGHEIVLMLEASGDSKHSKHEVWKPSEIAEWIVAQRDKLTDLLTTTSTSKPKARKINGATRKPRAPRASNSPTLVSSNAKDDSTE